MKIPSIYAAFNDFGLRHDTDLRIIRNNKQGINAVFNGCSYIIKTLGNHVNEHNANFLNKESGRKLKVTEMSLEEGK